jgi:XRE family aerobic/anaerobic benzoate catabolism transcriptional regulator
MATKAPTVESHECASRATTDLLEHIARNLRTLRSQRGMTRKQLAEQSGVSVPYLARVEGGDGNVSVTLLNKLAIALDVAPADILSGGEQLKPELAILMQFLRQQSSAFLAQLQQQLFPPSANADAQIHGRIALIGLRGAGKSTLGAALAKRLNLPFVELDKLIEQESGVAMGELITIYGQAALRRFERECLDKVVEEYPRVVLAAGGGIVANAGTYEQVLRTFFTVWLKARPETHFSRVMAQNDGRIATPSLQNVALDHIRSTLAARTPFYELARATLDTSDESIDAALSSLIRLVKTARSDSDDPIVRA